MKIKNGRFYADWRDEGGKRLAKSFATRREAEKYQGRMRAEVLAAKARGIGTVRQLAQAWIDGFQGSQDRRDHWYSVMVQKDLVKLAGDVKVTDLSWQIPNLLIAQWKNPARQPKPYAVTTVYGLRFRMKNLLDFFVDHGGSPLLVKNLQKTESPQPRQITLTESEVEEIKARSLPWFKCFFYLCFYGGLRTSEALRIAPENYNKESGTVIVGVKKRRVHSFVAHDDLKRLLDEAPISDDPKKSFVSLLKGMPVNDETCRVYFDKIIEESKGKIRQAIVFHDFRRTMCTWLYHETQDIRKCQAFLCHANLVTTLRYITFADNARLKPLIQELAARRSVVVMSKRAGAL